jgi:hypothetical protein
MVYSGVQVYKRGSPALSAKHPPGSPTLRGAGWRGNEPPGIGEDWKSGGVV